MTASKGPNRRTIVRWVGTAVGIGLLVYLLRNQGWDEILSAFRAIPSGRLAAAAALIMLSRFAVIGRWFLLLRSAHIAVSLGRAARLTFAGLFASNFLPTTIGGDVVRLAEVANLRERRVGYAASLIVDRGIGMLGMATLLPFGLREAILLVPRSDGSLLGAGGVAVFGRLSALGARLWSQLQKRSRELLEALRIWLQQPWGLTGSLLATWSHMLFRFGALWLLFRGLDEGLGLLQIGSLWSLVYFVTLLPISINGLGVQELTTTFVFTELGGVSPSSALTIAILLRTLEMAASLPGAFLLQGLLPAEGAREGSPAEDADPAMSGEGSHGQFGGS